MIPYVHSGIFPATINTAYRWGKWSAKQNILSIAKVVTFEVMPKLWGMEDWEKLCKERISWTRSKDFPVGIYIMSSCYFSIYFCSYSSSCYCIIVASSPYLMIICSLSPIFYTSSSSSCCSAKASWAYLEIAVLSSGGIEMVITPISPEEIWSIIFYERVFCDLFSNVSFEKLSSSCCNNTERIASLFVAGQNLKPFVDGWPYMSCTRHVAVIIVQ